MCEIDYGEFHHTTMIDNYDLPQYLYVSGAPIALLGFNERYGLVIENGVPRWTKPQSSFYGIPIRPTAIRKSLKNDNQWELIATDQHDQFSTRQSSLGPIGKWSGGFRVTDEKPSRWFEHGSLWLILAVSALVINKQFGLIPMHSSDPVDYQ